MSPKIVHKRDGYNMDFFPSGSNNNPKKQMKNRKIYWEVVVCNKGLNVNFVLRPKCITWLVFYDLGA